MTSNDHVSSMSVTVMVFGPSGDIHNVSVRLAGLRAASMVLGVPLAIDHDTPDGLYLGIALTIDDVRVRVTSGDFTGDDIPPARATHSATTAPLDRGPDDGAEPTAADLAAIAAETPLIAAELVVVDAEIAEATDGESEWTVRRLVAARRNLATVAAGFAPAGPDTFRPITPLSFHPMLRSA